MSLVRLVSPVDDLIDLEVRSCPLSSDDSSARTPHSLTLPACHDALMHTSPAPGGGEGGGEGYVLSWALAALHQAARCQAFYVSAAYIPTCQIR